MRNRSLHRALRPRDGVTLIELLVVTGIILVLAGLAIPTVRMLTRDVRVREAGRELQTFFEGVRSDARIYGQAGVLIERDPLNPHTAYRLHRVRVKPRYAGDIPNAQATIINDPGEPGRAFVFFPANQAQLMDPRIGVRGFGQAFNRVRLLDSDQFTFFIRAPADQPSAANNGFLFELIDRSGSKLVPKLLLPEGQSQTPFQVLPLPQKSSFASLTLPDQVYLDLSRSGFGVERDTTAGGEQLGFRKRFRSRLLVQDNVANLAEFDGVAPWYSPDAPNAATRATQYDNGIPFALSAPYSGAEFLGWQQVTGVDPDVVAPDGTSIGVMPSARLPMIGDVLIMFREDGSVDWVSNVWPKSADDPGIANWLSISNPAGSPNGVEAIVKLHEMFCFDHADIFLLLASDNADVDPTVGSVYQQVPVQPLADTVNLWATISKNGYFNLSDVDAISVQSVYGVNPSAMPAELIEASRQLAKEQITKSGR